MPQLEEKKELIMAEEERLANLIAQRIIEKPKLSFWMILIPIIFVFFFQKLNKVVTGRQTFVSSYLISRQRALDEAAECLTEKRSPDINAIRRRIQVPESAQFQYDKWIAALVEYYHDLLKGEGVTFTALARSAYRDREQFLLAVNHLCEVEKNYNEALAPGLAEKVPDAKELTEAMATHSRRLRLETARNIFSDAGFCQPHN